MHRTAPATGFGTGSRRGLLRATTGGWIPTSCSAAGTCARFGTVAAAGRLGLAAGVGALQRAIVALNLTGSLRTGTRLVCISRHYGSSRRQTGDDDKDKNNGLGMSHRHSPQLQRLRGCAVPITATVPLVLSHCTGLHRPAFVSKSTIFFIIPEWHGSGKGYNPIRNHSATRP